MVLASVYFIVNRLHRMHLHWTWIVFRLCNIQYFPLILFLKMWIPACTRFLCPYSTKIFIIVCFDGNKIGIDFFLSCRAGVHVANLHSLQPFAPFQILFSLLPSRSTIFIIYLIKINRYTFKNIFKLNLSSKNCS